MKLEYTFTNFKVVIVRSGNYELAVTGSGGDYRYKLTDLTTKQEKVSKSYKRGQDAERYGRKAFDDMAKEQA